MKNKSYLIFIFISLSLMITAVPVFAHKVNIFACEEGNEVYTESYFNDGKKCIHSKIEVFNDKEIKLTEGLTDDKGIFIFSTPESTYLKIVLTASAGHRAEYILELGDSGEGLPDSEIETKEMISEKILNENVAFYTSKNEISLIINEALDEKLSPILREIKKSQEDDISFSEIIGGIGYIFGIFGIIAYFLSRKK